MRQAGQTRTAVSVVVFFMLAVGGCAAPPPPQPAPAPSLYQRLGGKPAIAALVNDAVANIAADSRINQRFRSTNAQHLNDNLLDLLCQRAGGPCVYHGRNMADAHDGMHIRDDEFDALVEDVAKSFDKSKVPAAERDEALRILNQMRGAIVGH